MLKELVKLANHLDKLGHADLADQLDSVIKMAQDTGKVIKEDRENARVLKKLQRNVDTSSPVASPPATPPASTVTTPAATQDAVSVNSQEYSVIREKLKKLEDLISTDAQVKADPDVTSAVKSIKDVLDSRRPLSRSAVSATIERVKSKIQKTYRAEATAKIMGELDQLQTAAIGQTMSGAIPALAPAPVPAPVTVERITQADAGLVSSNRKLLYANKPNVVREIQKLLGVTVDGKFGKNTLSKYQTELGVLPATDADAALAELKAKKQASTPAATTGPVTAPASTTTAPTAAPTAAPATPGTAAVTTTQTAPAAAAGKSVENVNSLERLHVMLRDAKIYPKGTFTPQNFPNVDPTDLATLEALDIRTGMRIKQKIKRIIRDRYGVVTPKRASEVSETEERIQKISEVLQDLSFDFSKINGSVRR